MFRFLRLTYNFIFPEDILEHNLHEGSPIIVHACLTYLGAMMAVFHHSSLRTSSWLLKVQKNGIKLLLCLGINPVTTKTQLYLAISHVPQDIRTQSCSTRHTDSPLVAEHQSEIALF